MNSWHLAIGFLLVLLFACGGHQAQILPDSTSPASTVVVNSPLPAIERLELAYYERIVPAADFPKFGNSDSVVYITGSEVDVRAYTRGITEVEFHLSQCGRCEVVRVNVFPDSDGVAEGQLHLPQMAGIYVLSALGRIEPPAGYCPYSGYPGDCRVGSDPILLATVVELAH